MYSFLQKATCKCAAGGAPPPCKLLHDAYHVAILTFSKLR